MSGLLPESDQVDFWVMDEVAQDWPQLPQGVQRVSSYAAQRGSGYARLIFSIHPSRYELCPREICGIAERQPGIILFHGFQSGVHEDSEARPNGKKRKTTETAAEILFELPEINCVVLKALGILTLDKSLNESLKKIYYGPVAVLPALPPVDGEAGGAQTGRVRDAWRIFFESLEGWQPVHQLMDRVGKELAVLHAEPGTPALRELAGRVAQLFGER
jgi:hypothetical protein